MRWLHTITIAVFAILTISNKAFSQDYSSLFRDLNVSELTQNDKRFLQTALAFEGHYNGLLDGAWGNISSSAMSKYSWKNFGTNTEEWHLAVLAFSLFERMENDGWEQKRLNGANVSLLIPTKNLLHDPSSERMVNWRHAKSSLKYSIGIHGKPFALKLHNYTLGWHEISGPPYTVKKQNLIVTSSKKIDGSTLYTRSDFINGSWTTVMLSAERNDENILNAVASSISTSHAYQISFTIGGSLDQAIKKTLEVLDQENDPETNTAQKPSGLGEPQRSRSSGTGFLVSKEGHILTNAHVLEGCVSIKADGKIAKLVHSSKEFDLAIIHTDELKEKSVAIFSANPARLNSDVTAIGYPYSGLLGGLNVTRGSVSSLVGLKGDVKTMQMTAPVQSGNSGGPLVGPDGLVVGVVVSKLDALKFANFVGDLPQNVNFAIRGEIAKLYLAQNNINPVLSLSSNKLDPVDLASKAASFTSYIECQ